MSAEEGFKNAEVLDLTLDLAPPTHEGAFYRVQLPPGGEWSCWLRSDEPCPFDEVLSVQMHNVDWSDPAFAQIMGQFKVGGR